MISLVISLGTYLRNWNYVVVTLMIFLIHWRKVLIIEKLVVMVCFLNNALKNQTFIVYFKISFNLQHA